MLFHRKDTRSSHDIRQLLNDPKASKPSDGFHSDESRSQTSPIPDRIILAGSLGYGRPTAVDRATNQTEPESGSLTKAKCLAKLSQADSRR